MRRFWVCLLPVVAGCIEREAGPHPSEEGLVTYWEVIGSEGRASECTDSADWSSVVSGPVFKAGSYLMYRVEPGGQTATGQSCDTLSASSCVDSDKVWSVDGSVLTFEGDPVALDTSGDCDIEMHQVWTLVDEGETAFFKVQLQYEYEAGEPACTAIEAALQQDSPNGLGLENCTVTMDADMSFASAN